MPEPSEARAEPTPLEAALERVGDRWSLLLVEALLDGARRFNELADALPAIAPNILADRLRRLERERILVATPYQQRPPRMAYALTTDGRDLASALRLLADWGARDAPSDRTRSTMTAAGHRSRLVGGAPPARSTSMTPPPLKRARCDRTRRSGLFNPSVGRLLMDDERWEPGMPVLDRQATTGPLPPSSSAGLPPSLQGLPRRSVPETAPTPLQGSMSS